MLPAPPDLGGRPRSSEAPPWPPRAPTLAPGALRVDRRCRRRPWCRWCSSGRCRRAARRGASRRRAARRGAAHRDGPWASCLRSLRRTWPRPDGWRRRKARSVRRRSGGRPWRSCGGRARWPLPASTCSSWRRWRLRRGCCVRSGPCSWRRASEASKWRPRSTAPRSLPPWLRVMSSGPTSCCRSSGPPGKGTSTRWTAPGF
mmetsp:Transcript_70213/g.228275  ORF Transcript_70213/g.228275 Transcript_70213/m.228275 type:complete len:202 (+) Transcript_70213:215-820(+)